jgi:Protein of unknown function (DUF2274)
MAKLKLGAIEDLNPVRLTIELPAAVIEICLLTLKPWRAKQRKVRLSLPN